MTPTDEATFIALWQQGASYRDIAQALGCPLGTVASRSAALAAQGKIQPRPRGGAYSSRRAKARLQGSPSPVQSSAEQDSAVQDSAVQPTTALVPSPAVASAAIIDLLRQTLARLDTVEQDLKAIREDRQPSAGQSGAGQSSADPPSLSLEEARAERWNLWLPRGLRHRIEAVAKARGHAPSKVVQEALWQWINSEEAR
jgi:DNA-binding transcriptional MocR family regulator